jgi:hypothetical protein
MNEAEPINAIADSSIACPDRPPAPLLLFTDHSKAMPP